MTINTDMKNVYKGAAVDQVIRYTPSKVEICATNLIRDLQVDSAGVTHFADLNIKPTNLTVCCFLCIAYLEIVSYLALSTSYLPLH